VRILLDYRPALSQRTGVGEYVHELTRALARTSAGDEISVFTTSWSQRPEPSLRTELGTVRIVDHRLPIRGLAWLWHHFEWPPVEWLAGATDVVHGQSPLLIPARRAAQVVTIHDLDFLHRPDRAVAEMRRDYPRLVHEHARRADHVMVSSHYAAREVVTHLDVAPDRVSVCSPGAPEWARAIARERSTAAAVPPGCILFVGTLEPRKNIGILVDAYARLRERCPDAPPLVLAGVVRDSVRGELRRTQTPSLAGHVSILGYVSADRRRELYRQAQMLVLPSHEEGFGLPVLEAMASGVPVVVSNRGALPEVTGDAASALDPSDVTGFADEMERMLRPEIAREASARGLARAARYSWDACAASARDAYRAAVAARERRAP
jgi:glycosyltransferase involved in cell wall biosynthesis